MKEIGRGWQYVVYDLGNGRVRKMRWNNPRRFFRIWRQMPKGEQNPMLVLREMWRVDKAAEKSSENVRKIMPLIDQTLLGNPKFISATEYEQDKAEPIGNIISEFSSEESKTLIIEYIKLNIYFWRFGFAESVFNFTLNNGLNADGKIIFLDFGELSFNKQEVRQDIETKRWLRASSYRRLPENELKKHYREAMERELTIATLEESWGKSLTTKKDS